MSESPSSSKRILGRLTGGARYVRQRKKRFLALVVIVAHTVGALTSVRAVMETRTAQGAIAWAISLNTIPYVAVPAYWAFGSARFDGYVNKRRGADAEANPQIREFVEQVRSNGLSAPENPEAELLDRLAKLPATVGNDVELLLDGEAIFESIFAGIDGAEDYLLVQFYIVRDDGLGRDFRDRLVAAAGRGVKVRFLYDEVGCYKLPRSYLDSLRRAGVEVRAFNSTLGRANRFQINFRNHRKVVVADGRQAWVGGANVGDEYLGKDPKLSPWWDAFLRLAGPSVQCVQVPFWEDWYWASGVLLPDLRWDPEPGPGGGAMHVRSIASGPADRFETCALYFLTRIHGARERLWIASPYFVPDEQIVSALQLAALRGVDVRIVLPEDCDNRLVRWSGWSYVAPLEKAGVRVLRHTEGFMHHKAMLVDRDLSAVGTANFDNRSFRLNFELMIEVRDEDFASEVEAMFLRDFANSRESSARELQESPFHFRLAVRLARLMAPLQ